MTESILNKVLERGVAEAYPTSKNLEQALKNHPEKLTFYLGIDPTAPFIHLGHTIPVRKLEQLRQLGCKVILLIGGFTATVGDPTDKSAARKALSVAEVKANAKNYLKLLEPVLGLKAKKNPVKVMNNLDWWGKMSFKDFMELAQRFTAQRLLERDMFQERIKAGAPVYLHELTYPLLQAYDSVAMNVDGEIGATDQTFNMLMGRDLMQSMLGREKFVLTVKLLTDPSGKKMGKSEGNAVALDAKPAEMFGAIMSWPDGIVAGAFELLTDVEMKEVDSLAKQLSARDLKARLAYEIVAIYHGPQKAVQAEQQFNKVFQGGGVPDDIQDVKIKFKKIPAVDLLVLSGLAASKSEARRIIEQGGFAVDDVVIKEAGQEIEIKKGTVLRKGKRHFARIA